jgi:hypothetical protein
MSKYRAVVHYRFKEGMEEKGIHFLENELIKKAEKFGCHGIEIVHSEDDGRQKSMNLPIIALLLQNESFSRLFLPIQKTRKKPLKRCM